MEINEEKKKIDSIVSSCMERVEQIQTKYDVEPLEELDTTEIEERINYEKNFIKKLEIEAEAQYGVRDTNSDLIERAKRRLEEAEKEKQRLEEEYKLKLEEKEAEKERKQKEKRSVILLDSGREVTLAEKDEIDMQNIINTAIKDLTKEREKNAENIQKVEKDLKEKIKLRDNFEFEYEGITVLNGDAYRELNSEIENLENQLEGYKSLFELCKENIEKLHRELDKKREAKIESINEAYERADSANIEKEAKKVAEIKARAAKKRFDKMKEEANEREAERIEKEKAEKAAEKAARKAERKAQGEQEGQRKAQGEQEGQRRAQGEQEGQRKAQGEQEGQRRAQGEQKGQRKAQEEQEGQRRAQGEQEGQRRAQGQEQEETRKAQGQEQEEQEYKDRLLEEISYLEMMLKEGNPKKINNTLQYLANIEMLLEPEILRRLFDSGKLTQEQMNKLYKYQENKGGKYIFYDEIETNDEVKRILESFTKTEKDISKLIDELIKSEKLSEELAKKLFNHELTDNEHKGKINKYLLEKGLIQGKPNYNYEISVHYSAKKDAYDCCLIDCANESIENRIECTYERKEIKETSLKDIEDKLKLIKGEEQCEYILELISNNSSIVDQNLVVILLDMDQIYGTKKLEDYVEYLEQAKDKKIDKKMADKGIEVEYDLRGLYDQKEVVKETGEEPTSELDTVGKQDIIPQEDREELLRIANNHKKMKTAKVKKGFIVAVREKIENIFGHGKDTSSLLPEGEQNTTGNKSRSTLKEELSAEVDHQVAQEELDRKLKEEAARMQQENENEKGE